MEWLFACVFLIIGVAVWYVWYYLTPRGPGRHRK